MNLSNRKITNEAIEIGKIQLYPKNSVLMVCIGGTVGKIGYSKEISYSNQQITAIIPKDIDSKYLLYYIVSKNQFIKDNALYTTLPIMNNSYLGDIKIIGVPIEEQRTIVDYLDKKCNLIDTLITEKEDLIEKLEEYKKSLIYECVSGKKEVKA